MQNIDPVFPFTSKDPSVDHALGVERTEEALVSWLQKQALDVVGAPIFLYCSLVTSTSASELPIYHSFGAVCMGRPLRSYGLARSEPQ
jgi:hypothetical protein